ncbi:hypothetical protein AKJ44_00545 [candidate division MSBL1 archaeon SCGC-AAA261F17]|uniref:Peptidase S54 rhomboid domain-containing protein n=1 Tax=candidate division MSBL1 archaeon SCGC-AAA261F17 TaxID=1698274 RepID=A0A133V7H1_9EURY|nr:hypothetical protein AKJ44_00545 [candidate division MSBL1 archaeon SCGC-AAA261F17]
MFPIKDENPTETTPYLTIALIVVNLGIFLATFLSGSFDQIIGDYGMKPAELLAGKNLHTLFTSMFLHGGFLHVIGNVWFLWIFGDNIEDYFGREKFLLIYFSTGIVASLAHAALNPGSVIPTIGASGAIAGILGAYIVKYPRAKVYTVLFFFLFYVIKIPAVAFLGIWIGIQVLSATVTAVAGVAVSTAYWAHIGGFALGAAMVYLWEKSK